MAGLQLKVTTAGRAALVNATNTGTLPVTVAQIGVTATAFDPATNPATLPGELKRLATFAGQVVADDTIHVTLRDDSDDSYSMRGFGLYLADGTLFASYAQATAILEKSPAAMLLLSVDVRFVDIDASSLTFGDASFVNPPATTEVVGGVKLATNAKAIEGIDKTLAVPPSALKAAIDSRSGRARFEVSGTFTVPAGVTAIYVSACAGGGGGGGGGVRQGKTNGGASYTAAGGGGGGAGQSIQRVRFAVVPGTAIPIILGAGGAAGAGAKTDGANGGAGGAGGSTVIGNLVTLAAGMGGGGGSSSSSPAGGATGGDGYPAGGDSASITINAPYGPAGTGGSCAFGGGGPGGRCAGDTTSIGRKGFGFGAGGGGGGGVSNGASASTFGKDGAVGCAGFAFIEWC